MQRASSFRSQLSTGDGFEASHNQHESVSTMMRAALDVAADAKAEAAQRAAAADPRDTPLPSLLGEVKGAGRAARARAAEEAKVEAAASSASAETDASADAPLTIKARASAHEPFFLPMRLFFRISMASAALAVVLSVVVQQVSSSALSAALTELLASSDRAQLAERIGRRVQQAALLAGGLLAPVPGLLNFSSVVGALKGDADMLAQAHRTLYASAAASGLPEEAAIYQEPALPFLSLGGGPGSGGGAFAGAGGAAAGGAAAGGAVVSHLLGLSDGTTSFASRASSVAQQFVQGNPLGFSLASGDPFFLAVNGPASMRLGLNSATGASNSAVIFSNDSLASNVYTLWSRTLQRHEPSFFHT
jgi:hypothetical protein